MGLKLDLFVNVVKQNMSMKLKPTAIEKGI